MDVNGPGPVRPSLPVHSVQPTNDVSGASGSESVAPQDQLEISDAARMLEEIDQSDQLHQARLEQIKQEIENGTYESPEKLEQALGNLLREIESDSI